MQQGLGRRNAMRKKKGGPKGKVLTDVEKAKRRAAKAKKREEARRQKALRTDSRADKIAPSDNFCLWHDHMQLALTDSCHQGFVSYYEKIARRAKDEVAALNKTPRIKTEIPEDPELLKELRKGGNKARKVMSVEMRRILVNGIVARVKTTKAPLIDIMMGKGATIIQARRRGILARRLLVVLMAAAVAAKRFKAATFLQKSIHKLTQQAKWKRKGKALQVSRQLALVIRIQRSYRLNRARTKAWNDSRKVARLSRWEQEMAELKKEEAANGEPVAELKISREYRQTQYQIAVDSMKVKKNYGGERINAAVDIQKLWRLALFKWFLSKRIAKRRADNEQRAKCLRLAFVVQPVIRRYLKAKKDIKDSVWRVVHPQFKPLVARYLGGGGDGKIFLKELRLNKFICPEPTLANAHLNYDQRPRMLWNCLHWCGLTDEESRELVRRKIVDYTPNEDDEHQPHWNEGSIKCEHAQELLEQRKKVTEAREALDEVKSTIMPLEVEERDCIVKEEDIKTAMKAWEAETSKMVIAQELTHAQRQRRDGQLSVMQFTLNQTVKLHRQKLNQIKETHYSKKLAEKEFKELQARLIVVAEEAGEVKIEGRVRVINLCDTDCPKGQGCTVTIGEEVYQGVHPVMAAAIDKEQIKRKKQMERRLQRKAQGYEAGGEERDEHGVAIQQDDYTTAHIVALPQCQPCSQRLVLRLHKHDAARAIGPKDICGTECSQVLIDRCRSRYCEFPWDCWSVTGSACPYRKVFISQYMFWKFVRMVNEQLIRADRADDHSQEWMLVHDFIDQATNAQHMTLAFLKSSKDNLGKQQRKRVGRLFQQKVAREMFHVAKTGRSDPFAKFARQKAMQVQAKLWCPTEAAKEEKAARLAKAGKRIPGALGAAGTGKHGQLNWFRWRHKRELCFKCYSIRKNPQKECAICEAPPRCTRTAGDMKEATGGQAKHAMLDRRNLWSAEDLHTPVAQFIVHAAIRFVAPLYHKMRSRPSDNAFAMAAEQTKVCGWILQLHNSGVYTVADLAKVRRAPVFEFGIDSLLVHRLQWPEELSDAVSRLLAMVDKQIVLHHSIEGRAKEALDERHRMRLTKYEAEGVDIGRGKGNLHPDLEGYTKPSQGRELVQKQAWGDRGMNVGSNRRKPPMAVRKKLEFQRTKKADREYTKKLAQMRPSERRLELASAAKSKIRCRSSRRSLDSTADTNVGGVDATMDTDTDKRADERDESIEVGAITPATAKKRWTQLKSSVEETSAKKTKAGKSVEESWHGGNAIGWLRKSSVTMSSGEAAEAASTQRRWKEGERVEVNFYDSGNWSVATVSIVHDDGGYDVIYDDHDSESNVSAKNIRVMEVKERKARVNWRRASLEETHAEVRAEMAAACEIAARAAAGVGAGVAEDTGESSESANNSGDEGEGPESDLSMTAQDENVDATPAAAGDDGESSDDEQYRVVQSLPRPNDGRLMKMKWAPNIYQDALDEADALNVTHLLSKRPRSMPLRVQAEVQRQRVGNRVDPRTRLQSHKLPKGGVGGGRGMDGDGTEGRQWKDGMGKDVEMPSITRHNNGDTDASEGRMTFKRGPGPCGVPGGVERRANRRRERAKQAVGHKGFRAGKSALDEDGFAEPFDPLEEANNADADDAVADGGIGSGGEGEDEVACTRVSFCFRKGEQDENQRQDENLQYQSTPVQQQKQQHAPTQSPSPNQGGVSLFQKLALEFRQLATSVKAEPILQPELIRTPKSSKLVSETKRATHGSRSVLASGAKRRAHEKPEGLFNLTQRGLFEGKPVVESVCTGGMGSMSVSDLIADAAPVGGRSIFG
jgi:hypothetical protein